MTCVHFNMLLLYLCKFFNTPLEVLYHVTWLGVLSPHFHCLELFVLIISNSQLQKKPTQQQQQKTQQKITTTNPNP